MRSPQSQSQSARNLITGAVFIIVGICFGIYLALLQQGQEVPSTLPEKWLTRPNLHQTTYTKPTPGVPEKMQNIQRYSKNHVPNFCSKFPVITDANGLPVLTPSMARYELNTMKDGSVPQNDSKILNYLWDRCDVFLRPPSGVPTQYSKKTSMGQDQVVRRLLGSLRNGFYVECGALDGIWSSNTVLFEKDYGWQGLLIEADPANLVKLHKHNRNAWVSHSCLSTKTDPTEAIFAPTERGDGGQITSVIDPNASSRPQVTKGTIQVQCFPLYSYLAALGISTVDYLSLDIEGLELEVLKTIPFDEVLIKVVSVEFVTSKEGPAPLRAFMESKNYITAHTFLFGTEPFDLIFVHKSVNVDPEVLKALA